VGGREKRMIQNWMVQEERGSKDKGKGVKLKSGTRNVPREAGTFLYYSRFSKD